MFFRKKEISDIKNKKGRKPLVVLTAYTYPIAKILDEYCDIILVGDSLGMAIYGHEDTLSVSLDMMINHGKAVVKARKNSFVIIDMPYGTYENSKEEAYENAKKIIDETGADALKLETPAAMAETVKFLVDRGIKVIGHIGLMPQHIKEYGGYKYQGRDAKSSAEIIHDAKTIEAAGAIAIVIEAVPAKLATEITEQIKIPTIGIGASPACDGQVLVIDDLIGLNQEFKPRFVKNYTTIAKEIKSATANYAKEVHSRQFPGEDNLL